MPASGASAEAPAESGPVQLGAIRIEQARQEPTALTLFLYGLDDAGGPVADLPVESFTAFLGSRSVPVDTVRPFHLDDDGVAVLFLLDVSRSIRPEAFQRMRDAVASWRRSLGPGDRAALMTFGSSVQLVSDFDADSTAFLAGIDSVGPRDDDTRFYEGLTRAVETARQGGAGLPTRRVVVTVSDGVDDNVGGATREELLEAIATNSVPVYGIGFAGPAGAEEGLQALGSFARRSGGAYFDGVSQPLDSAVSEVREHLNAALVMTLDCSDCPRDGAVYRLRVSHASGSRERADELDVRMRPSAAADDAPTTEEGSGPLDVLGPPWILAALGALLLAVILLLWWGRRRAAVAGDVAVAGTSFASEDPPRGGLPRREAGGGEEPGTVPSSSPSGGSVGAVGGVADPGATAPVVGAVGEATPGPTIPVEPALQVRLTPLAPSRLTGRTVEIRDEVTLGREETSADIAFQDPSVSSVHCVLSREGDELFVEDRNSTNGTFVNGVPVRGRRRIEDDDIIRLGQFDVRVHIVEAR